MRSRFSTNPTLLENQVRKYHDLTRRDQCVFKDIRIKENKTEPNIDLEFLLKEPPEYTGNLSRTKIYIKNMVCIRCKMIVKAELKNLGLNYSKVEIGEAEIIGPLSDDHREQLAADLLKFGLELMEDKKIILVEKIKTIIIEMIHYSDELPNIKFSYFLSKKLNYSYTYLSNLFAEVNGISIQHFIVLHKIEKLKELLMYEELTISEIAWKLNYSSAAHLSNQFKQITGLTPTHFKNLKNKTRNNNLTI